MIRDRITFGYAEWDFVSIVGLPQVPISVLKTIKMPGVDGKAFKFLSREGKPSRLMLYAVATNLAAEAGWISGLAELTGRQVGIYSGTGLFYPYQVFRELTHKDSVAVGVGAWGSVDLGDDGRLLTFEATVEYPYGY